MTTALAILCGLGIGVGLWAIVGAVPRLSRPRLAHRVAPYLVDVSPSARAFVRTRESSPLPVFGALLGPVFNAFTAAATKVLGGSSAIEGRLRQAGLTMSVDAFRSSQLMWTLFGFAIGTVLSLALAPVSSLPLAAHLLIVVIAGVSGFFARDYALQRAVASRRARIATELPVVLEFLTLSLSAGEGILSSFQRVSTQSSGELATELGGVVSEVHSGLALAESLQRLSDGIRMSELTRCTDQLIGALERGTPLVEVLRAQAQDSREQSKRSLLELAGKKEVAMMMPLVFLILPVTVIFAVFPGVFVLQLGF